jgi:hypothetical protein
MARRGEHLHRVLPAAPEGEAGLAASQPPRHQFVLSRSRARREHLAALSFVGDESVGLHRRAARLSSVRVSGCARWSDRGRNHER